MRSVLPVGTSSAKKKMKKIKRTMLGKPSRNARDISQIHAYNSTLVNLTTAALAKDVVQLVNEQLLSPTAQSTDENGDQSILETVQSLQPGIGSPWVGCDVLFLAGVLRTRKPSAASSFQQQPVYGSVKFDRYILILRRNEISHNLTGKPTGTIATQQQQQQQQQQQGKGKKDKSSVFLLYLLYKDGQLEVKNHYDMKTLKSIDCGAEDTELLLSFDSNISVDRSLYFASVVERDETIFVLLELGRYVLNIYSQITVGYSIDVDNLRYNNADINAAILNKFPQLSKALKMGGYNLSLGGGRPTSEWTDFLHEEETEAENLLDELNWSVTEGDHKSLHHTLNTQSEKLNMEIIDLLLQWEEMDDQNAAQGIGKSSSNYKEAMKISKTWSSAAAKTTMGVRDTTEVLSALQSVVEELEGVDTWLNEQIDHIAEVQANLHLIEDESGTLETTWKNLNELQTVVSMLVTGYTVSAAHEALLTNPQKIIQQVMKAPDLTNISEILDPLLSAAEAVRDSLFLKLKGVKNISPQEWNQLQSISAVSSQKAKIAALADGFCSSIHDMVAGLFDWLLKHKTFIEGSSGKSSSSGIGGGGSSQGRGQFAVRNSIEECLRVKLHYFLRSMASPKLNHLLHMAQVLRANLTPFLPLVYLFLDLSPNESNVVHVSYSRAVGERLYAPAFKALCKDLLSAVNPKHTCVSLAYPFRFHSWASQAKVDLPLSFEFGGWSAAVGSGGSSSPLIQPWVAFKIALAALIPAVNQEEDYVKEVFDLNSAPAGVVLADASAESHTKMVFILDTIFETAVPRLDAVMYVHSPSAASDVDGVEALAMYTTLHIMMEACVSSGYIEDTQGRLAAGSVAGSSTAQGKGKTAEVSVGTRYVFKLYESLRSNLWGRFMTFVSEQIHWINAQKADPKAPEVLTPFVRYPLLVLQIREMTAGMQQHFPDAVTNIFHHVAKVATELFQWLSTVAKQSDKYMDKMKITNFGYFEVSMAALNEPVLKNFVSNASQQKQEATVKYVNWMVSYEFPALSALAVRMDGVGSKVHGEELSLYIRRKDVLAVLKELDLKSLESNISAVRKRLEKHFKSDFDVDLGLVRGTWSLISERVGSILLRLEEAALTSYQIKVDHGHKVVRALFDKMA